MSAELRPAALSPRQAWLDLLVREPEQAVRDLIRGYVDIPASWRGEPADAAAALLHNLPADDPAAAAFDQGCGKTLAFLRQALLDADSNKRWEQTAALTGRLLAVIRRVTPPNAAADLHRRYAFWFNAFETAVFDEGLGLRRDFWRTLALTQDAAPAGMEPRRLMKLWFEICGESGEHGRYPLSYLDVGLLGLRRLPLGAEHSSNEEAVCHGLGRWAMRQQPPQKLFLERWEEIEALYPRASNYWPPLVEDVIAAQESALDKETNGKTTSFPAATWWRDALDLPRPAKGKPSRGSGRKRSFEPPARDLLLGVLNDAAKPIGPLQNRITQLINSYKFHADATGDVYYLVRSACNVGMRLLQKARGEHRARGELAVWLACQALGYEPANAPAWALWRDGLTAQGAYAAAEIIGWETIRQFPENEQWRTQLATLLTENLGRPKEAEALLRETIRLFPDDAPSRNQLATLLAEKLGHPKEAEALLRETIRLFPSDHFAYTQLATWLFDHDGDQGGALAVLNELFDTGHDRPETRKLHDRIAAGQRRTASANHRRQQAAAIDGPLAELKQMFPDALARRTLFRYENNLPDEGAADGHSAYARYVAARRGEAGRNFRHNDVSHSDAAFAIAFADACRAQGTTAAAQLQRLADQTRGVNADIARIGVAIVSNAPMPQISLPADPHAAVSRLAALTERLWRAPAGANDNEQQRGAALRMLRDFAASGLSSGLALAA